MGMDIYGISPVIRSKEPVIEWETSTNEERIEYFKSKRQYERENPGIYFRANIWSWRPIAAIIDQVNEMYSLDLPGDFIARLNENSGAGLKTQDECDTLANFIEAYVQTNFEDWETIGLNSGFYSKRVIGSDGEMHSVFVGDEEGMMISNYIGSVPFIKNNVIEIENRLYTASYSVELEDIKEFVSFLRECGGFEIH